MSYEAFEEMWAAATPEERILSDLADAPLLDESRIEHHFRTTGETELSVTLRSDHAELD